MKIKNWIFKQNHKHDGIGVGRIRTFPFSSDSVYDSVASWLIGGVRCQGRTPFDSGEGWAVSYRVTSIDPFFMTIFRINFKRFLGNCPPTPPRTQHFALSEKQMLTLSKGRGRWPVSQKLTLIQFFLQWALQ